MPQTVRTTLSAMAAIFWFSRPAMSRKSRAILFSGTIPSPTSLVTIIMLQGFSFSFARNASTSGKFLNVL